MPPLASSPVIPVLDLMIGQIVLAQSGDRGNYQPVHSKLTTSSQPLDVAKALFQQTGCHSFYLADIDSFAGAQPNWRVYNELLNFGFSLWVDANWRDAERISQIQTNIQKPAALHAIVSSETLTQAEDFAILGELQTANIQAIFSLDRKSDNVITQPGELQSMQPSDLIQLAIAQGVENVILLELDAVGSLGAKQSDSLAELIGDLATEFPDLRITSGGGIRSADDIQKWLDTGVEHVLVATAIHEGLITPFEIAGLY